MARGNTLDCLPEVIIAAGEAERELAYPIFGWGCFLPRDHKFSQGQIRCVVLSHKWCLELWLLEYQPSTSCSQIFGKHSNSKWWEVRLNVFCIWTKPLLVTFSPGQEPAVAIGISCLDSSSFLAGCDFLVRLDERDSYTGIVVAASSGRCFNLIVPVATAMLTLAGEHFLSTFTISPLIRGAA